MPESANERAVEVGLRGWMAYDLKCYIVVVNKAVKPNVASISGSLVTGKVGQM